MIHTLVLPTRNCVTDKYVTHTHDGGVTIEHSLVDADGIEHVASVATLNIVPEALPAVLSALSRAAREVV